MAAYNDWVRKRGAAILRRFDEISARYNFDNGDELEVAVAQVLTEFLPTRYRVARGFAVTIDGEAAGDDIVVYDVHRFPTLRSLGNNLGQKDDVPIEAVLGYIEAKHTLRVTGGRSGIPATGGQSLSKACKQVSDVKSLPREPVLYPAIRSGDFPPGYPKYRNPLFGAVLARYVELEGEHPEHFLGGELGRLQREGLLVPDLVAVPGYVTVPVYGRELSSEDPEACSVRPLHCTSTELVTAAVPAEVAFGVALTQMVWAFSIIELGHVKWSWVTSQALGGERPCGWTEPPQFGPELPRRP